MPKGNRAGWSLGLALALAGCGAAGTTPAAPTPLPTEVGMPVVAITATASVLPTSEKENRSPAQQKIESNLLLGIRQARGEATDGPPVQLPLDGNNRVELDIRAEVSDALLNRLRGYGMIISEVNARFRTIIGTVELQQIEPIAADADVLFIQLNGGAQTNQP
jgi:hypothetical protein